MKIELLIEDRRISVDVDDKKYEVTASMVSVDGKVLAYKQEGYEEVYNNTVESIIEEIESEIDTIKDNVLSAIEVIKKNPRD